MKLHREQTYYELLDVTLTASPDDVQAAYSRAMEVYGPDSVALYALEDPGQAERLRAKLAEAVSVLTDDSRRLEYDRRLGLVPPAENDDAAEGAALVQLSMLDLLRQADAVAPRTAPALEGEIRSAPQLAAFDAPSRVEIRSADPVAPPARQAAPEDETWVVLERKSEGEEVRVAEPPPAAPAPSSKLREVRAKPEILPDAEFNGELLRQVRESRGFTLPQLVERTRISTRHLENIEADRYDQLPPTVYLRGIVSSVARELGLDVGRVCKSYLELVKRARAH